jgi:hypothetical protein
MILFINGFQADHWGKHEATARYPSCFFSTMYGKQDTLSGIVSQQLHRVSPLGGAMALGACMAQSLSDKKGGYVYSPSRQETMDSPMYKGESMNYWNPVKKQISDGFNDTKMLFVNGSSDNRTTGENRFEIGVKVGNKIVAQWTEEEVKAAEFKKKFNELGKELHEQKRNYARNAQIYSPTIPSTQLEVSKLVNDYNGGGVRLFALEPDERLKIVGHSMGAAVSAGVATVIARSKFAHLLEVVFYLAPHQPHAFKHPENIIGYQSSSKEDLIATKNDLQVTDRIAIPTQAGKGYTTYKKIDGVQHEIIVNADHNGKGFGGHSVGTYKEEIATFFKAYKPR